MDGLAEETFELAIQTNDGNDIHESSTETVSRLQQEARDAQKWRSTGLRDVTKEFTAASNQLEAGQLIKDDFFTLFEAVGALEIMDPKMDSGYVAPDDTFEAEFDPTAALNANEVIWIMDQLLCLEISFLEGYPLSQTVYTSLHIDRLISPDQPTPQVPSLYRPGDTIPDDNKRGYMVHIVLRTFCEGLIKCCNLALDLIQSQNFYDEEDFVTHLFGRELLPKVSADSSMGLLIDILELLDKKAVLADEIQKAVQARIRFRLAYLRAYDSGDDWWIKMQKELELIKKSHHVGVPRTDAFSEKIQRQLATSTPPRPMLDIPFQLACDKWHTLIQDMHAPARLLTNDVIMCPHSLQRATWVFADRNAGPLARAQMQEILCKDQMVDGRIPHFELLITNISDMVLAGDDLVNPDSFLVEVTSDPRHICSRHMERFMDKAIEEFVNLYRMVCQNRCRIRRLFTQSITILDRLQSEAIKIDAALRKHTTTLRVKTTGGGFNNVHPLNTWVLYHKLQIQAWTVQLGFETDIYQPDELCSMYWFLSHLCAQRGEVVGHSATFMTDNLEIAKKARNWGQAEQIEESRHFVASLSMSSDITKSVAMALSQVYFVIAATGLIAPPPRDYSTAKLFYEARMKPFLRINNESIPSCEEFLLVCHPDMSIYKATDYIRENLKTAKTAIAALKEVLPEGGKYMGTHQEWKKEIKQIETICVAISVVVSQLQKAVESHGKDLRPFKTCILEKKYHHWWVVPQLKDRTS